MIHRTPATDIFESKINHRRKAKDDHKELEDFGVDRRGQSALQNIHQHDTRTDPEREVIVPTQQLVEKLGQRVHRDAGRKNGHDRKGDGVQRADPLIEPHLQIFWHGPSLGTVIKRHHEHREEDHRRNRAQPVKVRRADAVFRSAGCHPNKLQRTEVGRNKG